MVAEWLRRWTDIPMVLFIRVRDHAGGHLYNFVSFLKFVHGFYFNIRDMLDNCAALYQRH